MYQNASAQYWSRAHGKLGCEGSVAPWTVQASAAEKKAARKTALEKIRSDAVEACLTAPFVEAAVANAIPTCISLALAWQSYTECLRSQASQSCCTRAQLPP